MVDFRDVAGALASGFNQMRLRPDPGLDTRLQTIQQQRTAKRARNKTVEYLRGLGTDMANQLASMVESGALTGQQAYAQILQLQRDEMQYQREVDAANLAFDRQKQLELYKATSKIISGADAPAEYRSLDMIARAGGLKPISEGGDGRYEPWMLSAGKGEQQAAKNLANKNFEDLAEYGKSIQKASRATELINRIKSNRNLDGVLGRIEGNVTPASAAGFALFNQDEVDLIQLIENLENSVFLEAFETLKGGGQITELEGEKAQRAIVNLKRDRSKEGFIQALNDLQEVIDAGADRATKGVQINNPYTKDLVLPDYTPSSVGSGNIIEYDSEGNRIK